MSRVQPHDRHQECPGKVLKSENIIKLVSSFNDTVVKAFRFTAQAHEAAQ
jgi:hypothetical protein